MGLRVFGIDPAFDGMAPGLDLLLPERQGLSGGDFQLVPDQIEAGRDLGNGVLHLQPGVHFQEVEIPLPVQQKFYGSRIDIPRGPGGGHRRLPHLPTEVRRQRRRGGFFDDLLVTPLDGTFPLKKMDYVPEGIGQDLKLHMPRAFQMFLQIKGPVSEGLFRFALDRIERPPTNRPDRRRSASPCPRLRRRP